MSGTMFCCKRMSKPNWHIWQQTDNLNYFHNQKSFRTINLGHIVLCLKISALYFSFAHFWDTHFWTIHIVNVFSSSVACFSRSSTDNRKCVSEAVSLFCLQSKLHISSSTPPMGFFLHYPAGVPEGKGLSVCISVSEGRREKAKIMETYVYGNALSKFHYFNFQFSWKSCLCNLLLFVRRIYSCALFTTWNLITWQCCH